MNRSSPIRRTLFMHPAHQRVGVSGDGLAVGPYCRIENFVSDDAAVAPQRVLLAASNSEARAATAFERMICMSCDFQCRRVQLDAASTTPEAWTDADSVVLVARGLQMARHWSDLDASALLAAEPGKSPRERIEVEIAPAARWHPVLDGVGPFVSRHDAVGCIAMPADATPLLLGRTHLTVQPVAWLRRGRHGRVFSTTLGSAADFARPDFVRLAINALAWIGR